MSRRSVAENCSCGGSTLRVSGRVRDSFEKLLEYRVTVCEIIPRAQSFRSSATGYWKIFAIANAVS